MMTHTAHPPHDWRTVPPEVARHGVILDDHGARVAAGHLRFPPTSRLVDRPSGHCPERRLGREAAPSGVSAGAFESGDGSEGLHAAC